MPVILLISPYWKEPHRWMVSSVKLAELWQRLGHRVVVVCMGSESGVEVVSDTLTIHRRKDFFLPDPLNFGIALGFAGYVRKVMKEVKPDLIVANKILFWSSFSLIPLKFTGHKVLLLTDALVGMTWWPRGWWPKVVMAIGAWTVGWLVMLCADRIVFFHPQPQRLLKRLGVAHKTQVIPTGIDHTKYVIPNTKYEKKGGDAVSVTYVGRLESVKGADDFLAAVVPLKKEYPNVNAQVVGWFKEGHPLVRRYKDDVEFTGLRDDIPKILAATDIFVMPSYSEGLSNAIMEAMASGCACVVSEVGGNCYLIQNGISGFHFPAGDRAALQSHVRRLIEDSSKRSALGQAARERIQKKFSWEVVGEKYEALFKELLRRNQES